MSTILISNITKYAKNCLFVRKKIVVRFITLQISLQIDLYDKKCLLFRRVFYLEFR